MAECVSCGKEIPAGKFFCDECYVRMKGRKGTLREVPQSPAGEPASGGSAVEVPGESKDAGEPSIAGGVTPERKASGTLTPASDKKVVSIKPASGRSVKEKAGKKRFTVTISFSEKTYTALSRLRGGRSRDSAGAEEESAVSAPAEGRPRRAARGRGPHGRPHLKAVAGKVKPPGKRGGFMRVVSYRDRPWDRGDKTAAVLASFAASMIIVLSFLPWARVTWAEGEGGTPQVVEVTGVDLGAMTYACIALAALAFMYMIGTWMFKGPFARIDYGVVLIAAGIVFIPLLYATIASNPRLIGAALEEVGRGGGAIPVQYERQTLWPAYAMVFMGTLLAFSGLIRLGERRPASGAAGLSGEGRG